MKKWGLGSMPERVIRTQPPDSGDGWRNGLGSLWEIGGLHAGDCHTESRCPEFFRCGFIRKSVVRSMAQEKPCLE